MSGACRPREVEAEYAHQIQIPPRSPTLAFSGGSSLRGPLSVALELHALRHDSEHPAHRLEVVHAVPCNLITAHPQVGCARERDAPVGHHPLHGLMGRRRQRPDSVAQRNPDVASLIRAALALYLICRCATGMI
jgi:hypothetical protein